MNKKKSTMVISDYYNSLGKKAKGDMLKQIMNRCGISYSTVTKKIKNDSWTMLEREVILNMYNLKT